MYCVRESLCAHLGSQECAMHGTKMDVKSVRAAVAGGQRAFACACMFEVKRRQLLGYDGSQPSSTLTEEAKLLIDSEMNKQDLV